VGVEASAKLPNLLRFWCY